MASDIEFGFFDRLLAAPVHRTSLVLGRLCGHARALAAADDASSSLVAMLFGAPLPGRRAGRRWRRSRWPASTAVAMGGVSSAIALRTGSLSLLQSLFPFMFVLLFTAPAFFPQELLTPVLHDVSVYNPLTYVVEGVRGMLSGDTGARQPAGRVRRRASGWRSPPPPRDAGAQGAPEAAVSVAARALAALAQRGAARARRAAARDDRAAGLHARDHRPVRAPDRAGGLPDRLLPLLDRAAVLPAGRGLRGRGDGRRTSRATSSRAGSTGCSSRPCRGRCW